MSSNQEAFVVFMLQEISLSELKVGMFVERVVEQTGNVLVKSSGLVKSDNIIKVLESKGVTRIEINLDKSKVEYIPPEPHASPEPTVAPEPTVIEESPKETAAERIQAVPNMPFSSEVCPEKLEEASALYDQAKDIQKDFVKQLRSGATPDFNQLNHLSQDIIDSVFDNSESLACLMMLKGADDYLVEHALNCSILLAMFANYKKMSQAEVEDLTQAGLLMDIGMASLPTELLAKQDGFSASDWTVIRSHIDIGYELVERFADVPPIVYDVIQNHHERADGSGYPKGKTAQQLSDYAQMAAIVDSYDAMITNRVYKCSDNATDALKKLQSDPSMNTQLVREFINAIGLHPVGSLVKLSNDRLALVSKRNVNDPLKPVVMSFYHIQGHVHTDIERVDLAQTDTEIVSGIRPEEFSISLSSFFKKAFLPVG